MNKELKEKVIPVFKIEIILCIMITALLFLVDDNMLVIAFQLGLLVASGNFLLSAYILHKSLSRSKTLSIVITTLLRISIILIIAIPFMNNFGQLLSYILGFTSHFLILLGMWLTKLKGCS